MPTALAPAIRHLKVVFAIAFMLVCGALFWRQVQGISPAEIGAALTAIPLWAWGAACLATLTSFIAVGQYDAIWHKALGHDIAPNRARATGMAAIAIGQTIGFGTVTSGLVRWHLLSGRSIAAISALSIAVSLSFLACWAVLGLGAATALGLVPPLLIAGFVVLALLLSPLLRPYLQNHTAKLRNAPQLLLVSAFDVALAGVALWVLIPDAPLALLPTLMAAYCLALGNGLISNAPGGVGAFDLTLITLLPSIPEAPMVAGLLAFRVVYYLIPACLAAAAMAAVQLRRMRKPGHSYRATRQHLFGTVQLDARATTALHSTGYGFHALYKCNARLAATARARGWTVRLISRDAILNPQTWTDSGSTTRQLRRKLRQATKANVTITQPSTLPQPALAQIAQQWARNHGGELGYAMSRFHPATLHPETTFLIWHGTHLCGFITISKQGGTWTLDLIRNLPNSPHGAIQLAITHAIDALKARGQTRFSLGAVPIGPDGCVITALTMRGKGGLTRFKDAFAPTWEPRYHASPTATEATASLALITFHIQRPLNRLRHILMEFIKIHRIIHLIHNNRRGTPSPAELEPHHDHRLC